MKALRLTALFVVVGLLIAEAIPPASAAPGDLDLAFAGFGLGGKVITDISNTTTMALQPDGKIVVVGRYGIGLHVRRYLANGTLDSTFGEGGEINHFHTGYVAYPMSVAIQADGKIIIVGWADTQPANFMVARLTTTGEMDTSFSNDGWLTTDFNQDTDMAYAVVIQPDGKIIAGGRALVGNDYDFAAARYLTNGALDPSFGGDGKITMGFGCDDGAYDMALQDDGKLVLAGEKGCNTDADFAVARLNADGTPDNSFDDDGELSTGFGSDEIATAVAVQPDGKIIAAGFGSLGNEVKVARYWPDGALDDSFDDDGKLEIGSLSGDIRDMALQPDGRILLLGTHQSPDNDYKFAFYRLNPNGSLDSTFDDDGGAFIDLGGIDFGIDVALLPDGRILAFGMSSGHAALTRLWPNGTFDAGGKQTLGFGDTVLGPRADEAAHGLAVQPDGKIIVAGYIANEDFSRSDIALARFLPEGQLDLSFGVRGRVSFGAFVINVVSSVILQPDGKIVVAGYMRQGSIINFLVARFNSNGTPDTGFGFGGYNIADFAGGGDMAYALALAPDGKIVMAGVAWNGARSIFGVARFTSSGILDSTFDGDGKAYFDTTHANWASAVIVQRDRKIVVGGHIGYDFALVRFREDGSLDYGWGPGGQGWTTTDMGGIDTLLGLAINAGGWFYAVGSRTANSNDDFAVAQFRPNGVLATCTGVPCNNWPTGKAFVDWGGSDRAFAVDVRNDAQVLVAGSAGGQFGWAQFNPTTPASPLRGVADFVGPSEGINAVQFAGPNKIIAAGTQTFNGDASFALARFEARAFTPRFADVPTDYWAWQQIEAVFTFGITTGCQQSPRLYCSESNVTRAQMAAFLLRAKYGAYQPPAAICVNGHTSNFTDVACSDFFADYIEGLRTEGITSGCGPNLYCPNDEVTRAQMAIFLLRVKYGSNYTPPTATGIFADVPDDFFRPWIEQLAREGITSGCGPNVYCPNSAVTRAQMAAFLVRTLNLPLP